VLETAIILNPVHGGGGRAGGVAPCNRRVGERCGGGQHGSRVVRSAGAGGAARHAAMTRCRSEQGRGRRLTGGPRPQCRAAAPADRWAQTHSTGFESIPK
jgi:hypothetical protein